MRDAEKTVGNMIDKLKTDFIGSIDSEGFPNMKAMLQPRKREGIKTIYLTTNTSSMRVAQYRETARTGTCGSGSGTYETEYILCSELRTSPERPAIEDRCNGGIHGKVSGKQSCHNRICRQRNR